MTEAEQAWSVVVGLGGFAPGDKVFYTNEELGRIDWPGVVVRRDERELTERYIVVFPMKIVKMSRSGQLPIPSDTLTLAKHRLRMRME